MAAMESLTALVGADGELAWLVLAIAVLAVFLLRVLRGRHRPQPGEVWFAQVPFADGSGSKDRPVLVLEVQGHARTVAQFTSQDKTGRRDHRRVPDGVLGLQRASWVHLQPFRLGRSAFRRRLSSPGLAVVHWYAGVRVPSGS